MSRAAFACVLSCALFGCGAAERAAAKDPQRCERDPDCEHKLGNSRDCATACADNIECMDRCQQIRRATEP